MFDLADPRTTVLKFWSSLFFSEPSKQCKSTEDLQLEEIKRLQVEAKRKLRRSRQSFHRLAKVSGPMKTVKGSKPPTETKEFNFSKMTLGSSGRNLSDNSIPRSFADTLRSGNDTSCSYDTSMVSMIYLASLPYRCTKNENYGSTSCGHTDSSKRATFNYVSIKNETVALLHVATLTVKRELPRLYLASRVSILSKRPFPS